MLNKIKFNKNTLRNAKATVDLLENFSNATQSSLQISKYYSLAEKKTMEQ